MTAAATADVAPGGTARWLLTQTGLTYFLVAFIARVPFAMMVVGVLTLIVSERGSLALGGLNSAAIGVGAAVFGPMIGIAADRYGQRNVLVPVGFVNAALLAAFPFIVSSPADSGLVVASSLFIGATAPQIAPMSRARLIAIIRLRAPQDARPRVMTGTMAYESAADETVFVFGPFLVGIGATLVSPWLPVLIASALTLVFVTAFALHPTGRIARVEDADGTRDPLRHAFHPAIIATTVGVFGVGTFFGAVLTALTAFAESLGDASTAGLLYGVMGAGSAVLALGSALLPRGFTDSRRWLVFGCVMLAGAIAFGILGGRGTESMVAVCLVLVVMGVGIGPTLVAQFSLAAGRAPHGRAATVMAILGSSLIVGQASASAIAGSIAESSGVASAMQLPAVGALIVVIAAIAGVALDGRSRTSRV